MKICASCGASAPDGAVFCVSCNSKEFKKVDKIEIPDYVDDKPKIQYDQYGRPINSSQQNQQYDQYGRPIQGYSQPLPPIDLGGTDYGYGSNDQYTQQYQQYQTQQYEQYTQQAQQQYQQYTQQAQQPAQQQYQQYTQQAQQPAQQQYQQYTQQAQQPAQQQYQQYTQQYEQYTQQAQQPAQQQYEQYTQQAQQPAQQQYKQYTQQPAQQQYEQYTQQAQQPAQQQYQQYTQQVQQPAQQQYEQYTQQAQQPAQQQYEQYTQQAQQPAQQQYEQYTQQAQQPAQQQYQQYTQQVQQSVQLKKETENIVEEQPKVEMPKVVSQSEVNFTPPEIKEGGPNPYESSKNFKFEKQEDKPKVDENGNKIKPKNIQEFIAMLRDTKDCTFEFDKNDISTYQKYAVYSCFGLTFWLPFAFCSNSRYARFYANQGLLIFVVEVLATIVYSVFAGIIGTACTVTNQFTQGSSLSIIGWILEILFFAICYALPAFMIYCEFIEAKAGRAKEAPLLGQIKIIRY